MRGEIVRVVVSPVPAMFVGELRTWSRDDRANCKLE